ncbi:MAG: hypothetical protein V4629_03015 [Pseudomonadota bacterium]
MSIYAIYRNVDGFVESLYEGDDDGADLNTPVNHSNIAIGTGFGTQADTLIITSNGLPIAKVLQPITQDVTEIDADELDAVTFGSIAVSTKYQLFLDEVLVSEGNVTDTTFVVTTDVIGEYSISFLNDLFLTTSFNFEAVIPGLSPESFLLLQQGDYLLLQQTGKLILELA